MEVFLKGVACAECAHDFVKGLLIRKDLDLVSSETDAIVTKCTAVLGSGPSLDSMVRPANTGAI